MQSGDTDLQSLAARVKRLEPSNHRWRFASALLFLSGISMLLIAAKPADRIKPVFRVTTLEAREIVLKDEKRNICARLSVTPVIQRMNGHTSVITHQDSADRAILEIYDEKGFRAWTAPPTPTLVPAR